MSDTTGNATPAERGPWYHNPAWWAIIISLSLSVLTLVFQFCGGAVSEFFGTQKKVERLESRVEAMERAGKQLDEWLPKLSSERAELEGQIRALEVLKKDLLPFAKAEVLPFRNEDRDRLIAVVKDMERVNKQIELMDHLSSMHTQQLTAIRDMIKALGK